MWWKPKHFTNICNIFVEFDVVTYMARQNDTPPRRGTTFEPPTQVTYALVATGGTWFYVAALALAARAGRPCVVGGLGAIYNCSALCLF